MTEPVNTSLVREVQETQSIIQDAVKDGVISFSEGLSILLSILLVFLLFSSKTKSVATYLTKKRIKEQELVEDLITQLLALSQSNRVVIGLFHNGTTIGSIHFQKMSVIYEVYGEGVSSIKGKIQDKKIIEFEKEIFSYNSLEFTKFSRDTSVMQPECKKHLDYINVHTIYSRLLETKKGIYGILQLQYINKPEQDILEMPNIVYALDQIFNRLSTVLEYIVRGKKVPLN